MHNETTPSLAAWSSLLAISTRFDMKRIRSRAITEILSFRPRIDPVEQVGLAVKHGVPDWLPIAYAALCEREDAIEIEEAIKLGLETTVLLAKARERVRKTNTKPLRDAVPCGLFGGLRPSVPDPAPSDASVVDRILEEIFWPAPAKLPDPGPLDNSEAAREYDEFGDPVSQSPQPMPEFKFGICLPVVQPDMMEKVSDDPVSLLFATSTPFLHSYVLLRHCRTGVFL